MKITRKQLRQIIQEAAGALHEEESDCIKDYMRMGYSRREAQKECKGAGSYAIPTSLDADGDGVLKISETKNQNLLSILEADVIDMFSDDQKKDQAVERLARALAARAEEMLDADGDGDDIAVHVDHKLFLSPYTDFDGHKGEVPALADHVYNNYISGKAGDQAESLDSIIRRIGIDYFDEDIEYVLAALGDDRFDGTQDQMMKTKDLAAQQDAGEIGGMDDDFEEYLQGIASGKVVELEPYDDLAENNLNEGIMVPLLGIGNNMKRHDTMTDRWSRIAGLDRFNEQYQPSDSRLVSVNKYLDDALALLDDGENGEAAAKVEAASEIMDGEADQGAVEQVERRGDRQTIIDLKVMANSEGFTFPPT